MPFKSAKQKRYLWSVKPEVAREFAKKTKKKKRKKKPIIPKL